MVITKKYFRDTQRNYNILLHNDVMEKYTGLVFPCEYFIPENYTEIFFQLFIYNM